MREKQKESNFEHVMKVQAMGEKKDRERERGEKRAGKMERGRG